MHTGRIHNLLVIVDSDCSQVLLFSDPFQVREEIVLRLIRDPGVMQLAILRGSLGEEEVCCAASRGELNCLFEGPEEGVFCMFTLRDLHLVSFQILRLDTQVCTDQPC